MTNAGTICTVFAPALYPQQPVLKSMANKALPGERRKTFLENVADCAQGMKTDIQMAVMCAYIRISTYKKEQYIPELQVGIRDICNRKKIMLTSC